MRVAIVNDMRLAVEALRKVVASVPGYEVAWVALDGSEAVDKCSVDVPDLILMDLIMPVMNGVEATRRIMEKSPCAILVVTATVSGNAALVFEAMGHGALDAVCTPELGPKGGLEGAAPLIEKMTTMSRLIHRQAMVEPVVDDSTTQAAHSSMVPLVVIGASTGGPKVMGEILRVLPRDLNAALILVQHVDEQFAPGMAEWLSTQGPLPVRLAAVGDRPRAGEVLMAARNDHLILDSQQALRYTEEPVSCAYRPSVDVLFQSAARWWPGRDLAILLTGMGRDGAQGLLALRHIGWNTIAQDEASCVLYGMPRAAAELRAAAEILPPPDIATAILRFAASRQGARS